MPPSNTGFSSPVTGQPCTRRTSGLGDRPWVRAHLWLRIDGWSPGLDCARPALLNSQRVAPGFLPPRELAATLTHWPRPPAGVATRILFVNLQFPISMLFSLVFRRSPDIRSCPLSTGDVKHSVRLSSYDMAVRAECSRPGRGALGTLSSQAQRAPAAAPSSLPQGSPISVWPATTMEPRLCSQLRRSKQTAKCLHLTQAQRKAVRRV